jgi:hypothetical protein
MKARRPTDDQGRPLQPFERSREEWIRLGAPADLFDLEAAAAAELIAHGAILQPDEPGYPGPLSIYAHRWWRHCRRAAWLAEHDALTARERDLLDRFPAAYLPPERRR